MKRCQHDWHPLLTINTDGMDSGAKLRVAFVVGLERLNDYDRCQHCGRLSYVTKTRWHRRKLIGEWLTGRMMERLAGFEKWLANERTTIKA